MRCEPTLLPHLIFSSIGIPTILWLRKPRKSATSFSTICGELTA